MVEAELKMEVSEDMRAANMTASIRPLRPTGIRLLTSKMKALLLQPDLQFKRMPFDKWFFEVVFNPLQIDQESFHSPPLSSKNSKVRFVCRTYDNNTSSIFKALAILSINKSYCNNTNKTLWWMLIDVFAGSYSKYLIFKEYVKYTFNLNVNMDRTFKYNQRLECRPVNQDMVGSNPSSYGSIFSFAWITNSKLQSVFNQFSTVDAKVEMFPSWAN